MRLLTQLVNKYVVNAGIDIQYIFDLCFCLLFVFFIYIMSMLQTYMYEQAFLR